jgi:hypothetical protein
MHFCRDSDLITGQSWEINCSTFMQSNELSEMGNQILLVSVL